jgi:hypothetical protein
MVDVPDDTAVARPEDVMVATAGVDDDQAKTRPGTVMLLASLATAVNCCVAPNAVNVGLAGVTVTDAMAWVTVTAAAAVRVPDAAVIVAVPMATDVTSPVALTVATPAADEVHVIGAPLTTELPASLAVAVSCCVAPMELSETVVGATLTLATACATVTTAAPEREPVVAVIVLVPFATAVTSPALLTVAVAAADVAHVKAVPLTVLPPASRAVAVNCTVEPSEVSVDGVGVTVTDEATCATVAVAVPANDPIIAVITAVPFATAVTRPLAETVATAADEDDHCAVVPGTIWLFASRATAESCCVAPRAAIVTGAGLTATVVGTCSTVTWTVPEIVPAAALIVVDPFATAVTVPFTSTVATAVFDEVQEIVTGTTVLFEACAVAASCWVAPIDPSVMLAGVIAIVRGVRSGPALSPPHARRNSTTAMRQLRIRNDRKVPCILSLWNGKRRCSESQRTDTTRSGK